MFKALLLNVWLIAATSAFAEAQSVDYTVHANIIYHLTKYIEWPIRSGDHEFVIGVIGDTPLLEELQAATRGKVVNNKKIVIRNFSCSQKEYPCNILYISEDESRCLKNIVELTSASPMLIITEKAGLALKGSGINFIIVDSHLKMEINKNNIETHNLKVASELLSLGSVVNNKTSKQ